MNEQVWWYVARSSGIVAWGLITLSVCWGLFLSTKAAAKASQPSRLLDLHRFLGGLSVAFTAVHIVGLVGDSYVEFGWLDILVPWASDYEPTAVAWGVIAFWLLIAVEGTSLMMKKLPRKLWRHVHRLSFGLYVLSTVHGIQVGHDTGSVWYRMAMLASINVVAFLSVLLVLTHRKAAIGRPSRTAAPGTKAREPVGASS